VASRQAARVRRPTDVVESTRWLFAMLAVASLAITLPALVVSGDRRMLPAALASAVALVSSWSAGYLRRDAPLGMDLVDAFAILVFALACPFPSAALGFTFAALWFRSLYGSTRRALLRCVIYGSALGASLPLWSSVPGHVGGTGALALVVAFPTIFLTVIVGRNLAGSLRAREQSAQRDAVHLSVGSQLLGITDTTEILSIAWVALGGICAATPGLRVLKVTREGAVLRVGSAVGGFMGVPATLPGAVITASVVTASGTDDLPGFVALAGHADLNTAVGTPCAWASVVLPPAHNQRGASWLLLGAPHSVPAEAVVSIGNLTNQVTLALRNSEAHEELTVQATLDGLTGLTNRTSFRAALVAALNDESGQDTTLLLVDIDDFKDINDQLGHRSGDELLQEVAARLQQVTRPGDLCGRLGGDEFVVLLRAAGAAAAADVAQRIVDTIAAPARLCGGIAQVGASVGIAVATIGTDLDQLIHRADVAMYAAKANGKARLQVFEPGLLRGESQQATFERELAAAARNDELIVHYQPIVSLLDRSCVSVEALVRWQHPDRGLLFPDSFIEIAERTGAIHDIGSYVLRRACADAVAWGKAHPGPRLGIQVNVSALQLDDDGFIDSVTRCLSDFGLPAEQLVLEITETVVIASPAAIDRLKALAALGVVIAIDDFGTGYSALTTLRTLPARIVKIDRSFVAGSTTDPQDRAVIEAVVQMAAQMGLKTVAEGVETPEHEAYLKGIGADAAQGYLYLRPTTVEKFAAWLRNHTASLPGSANGVVIPFKPRHTA
jgi:diguanylate cyclase (GGDEF)-like protein